MASFIYSGWFLDHTANPDDQDREWVACITIDAGSAEEAQSWGDALAKSRADRHSADTFLRSSIETFGAADASLDLTTLPRIKAGELASDNMLGW